MSVLINTVLKKQKIDLFKQYFLHVCIHDDECLRLRDKFLSLFGLNGKRLLVEEYQLINNLVFGICKRLNIDAVYAVWITCCNMILKYWASRMQFYEEYNFLKYFLSCWWRYQQGVNLIYGMTIYVQNEAFKLMKNQIMEIVSSLFIEHFINFKNSQEMLFNSILKTINKLKKTPVSQQIDDLKKIFQLLLFLDSKNQIIYYHKFAFPYLKTLKYYYRKKTKEMFDEPDFGLIDYLKFVQNVLNKELMIADQFSFTMPLIRMEAKLLYRELISQYKSSICDYDRFHIMLDSESWKDVSYLYEIVKFDESIIRKIGKNFEDYIRLQLSSIELVDWEKNQYNEKASCNFTNQCYQLLRNWTQNIKDVFNNDTVILKSMINSFRCFLNSNEAFACIISLCIHFISMDNQQSTRQELIRSAFNLLSFVENKSAVMNYNRRFLCQRILYGLSYSIKDDIDMIAELFEKMNIDNTFNVKLLLNDYIKSYNQTTILDKQMHIFVLNSTLWNLDGPQMLLRLPKQFYSVFESFGNFFQRKDSKKTLKLNQNYGSALVVANLSKNRRINFLVTLPQLAILLVFNKCKRCSYVKLKMDTNLDCDSLNSFLQLFIEHELIINDNPKEKLASSTFEINEQFSEENIELNMVNWIKLQHCSYDINKIMNACKKVTQNNESVSVAFEANIDMDKFCVIEAAIVRTMKWLGSINNIKMLQQKVLLSMDIRYKKLLSLNEFTKIVNSLEKQGYLRCLDNGRIIYEP